MDDNTQQSLLEQWFTSICSTDTYQQGSHLSQLKVKLPNPSLKYIFINYLILENIVQMSSSHVTQNIAYKPRQ